MRTLPCSNPWSRRALLFVVFCALLAVPLLAQAGPAADNPSASAAGFLASLSAAPVSGNGSNGASSVQTPAPAFLTGCTSNDQCPAGQLCCLACGYSGCETRACFQPVRGHCPFFP
jgi:hypothetical protein